ncbi:D-alanyl-D-alanine carboxypeptidase family protein [Kineosporia succinea]|uniref:D-alanyl-D-alanine carboxypeptidase (Penicillin-binding protein 5/6) n=1 Tax=Kineosporia succinea TaxID=84632 RepID=A0ABT9P5A0_9ACTN|nr:hypothetical protein [Kineosporia succinea]MDP9827731.1 D-alanyl-D-alanine carboxypeptidase (penicillin-binding protein 5/6) [Kineosporia succinea]
MNIRRSTFKKRSVAGATIAVTAFVVTTVGVPPTLASAQPVAVQATKATKAKLLVSATQKVPGGAVDVDWPAAGRARLEVAGLATVGSKNSATAKVPTASIAKVMTAYTILKSHPLAAGASGPSITLTSADVASYNRLRSEGATVLKVKAGTRLTQRQLLQGLLISSGANFAETLARWDSGSVSKFVSKMNANARSLGMTNTTYVDPTGMSTKSASSTEDLLDLAPAAMGKVAFREIVKTKSAKIPLNTLSNTNKLLGSNNVIGIKTGTTTPAGACLLFAATDKVNGKTYTIYGVVLGLKGKYKNSRAAYAKAMVTSTQSELRAVTLLKKGTPLVSVTRANGKVEKYGVKASLSAPAWDGLAYRLSLPSGLAKGQTPKTITVKAGAKSYTTALVKVG